MDVARAGCKLLESFTMYALPGDDEVSVRIPGENRDDIVQPFHPLEPAGEEKERTMVRGHPHSGIRRRLGDKSGDHFH